MSADRWPHCHTSQSFLQTRLQLEHHLQRRVIRHAFSLAVKQVSTAVWLNQQTLRACSGMIQVAQSWVLPQPDPVAERGTW
jgi:hypothetical protein